MTTHHLSPEQLDELRAAYFYADDTDPATLEGISCPEEVPDWLIHQQYARIEFVPEDFFCTCQN